MLIAHAWVLELKVEFEWLHFYTAQLTQFIDLIKGIEWIQTSYLNIISATFSQRKIQSFVIHVIFSSLITNCSPFHSRNGKKTISSIDITIFWGKNDEKSHQVPSDEHRHWTQHVCFVISLCRQNVYPEYYSAELYIKIMNSALFFSELSFQQWKKLKFQAVHKSFQYLLPGKLSTRGKSCFYHCQNNPTRIYRFS